MESLMQEALDRVRRQYGVGLKLSKSRPGSVLPKIELQSGEIRFNPKLQSFLTLYNLMMQLEDIDSECVTLFRLYNLYLDNDAYSLAESILRQLEHELDSFVRQLRSVDIRSVKQSVEIQMLFFLLHEIGHAVVYHKSEVRQQLLEDAKKSVKFFSDIQTDHIPEKMKDYLRTFVPNGLPKELQQETLDGIYTTYIKHWKEIYDFSRYLQPENEWMLEECACDHFAWQRAFVQYMEKVGISGEAVMRCNIDLQLTLHIYNYDKAIESVFVQKSEEAKIDELREEGLRRAALRDCIYNFYKQTYPVDHASQFLSLAEKRDEKAKRMLVNSTVQHITDMNTLQDVPSEPFSVSHVEALEERFAEIERRILDYINN